MRLVIADNDRDYLDLLRLELTLESHDVVAAVLDGDAAVAACAQLHPDVLLVDFRMPPGPDGLETIKAVHDVAPRTVCVLHSNYRSADLRRRTGELGAGWVPKSTLQALRAGLAEAARWSA